PAARRAAGAGGRPHGGHLRGRRRGLEPPGPRFGPPGRITGDGRGAKRASRLLWPRAGDHDPGRDAPGLLGEPGMNVLDWSGPDFLGLYVALLGGCWLVAEVVWHLLHWPSDEPSASDRKVHPLELVYLSEGAEG